MTTPLHARELMANLDAISYAVERGENEDSTRSETLSVFANWAQGIYGSGSDTDIFIICPRTTDGTVMLEGSYERLLNFFGKLGESQGVLVFEATLEYIRMGMAFNLEAFTPPWVTIRPSNQRAVYVFDKDTMYQQQCMLRNVYNIYGHRVCAASTANKGAVLPRDAFTSRPPDHIFFNERVRGDRYNRGSITETYTLRVVVLIPKNRLRRALDLEKEIMNAISDLKSTPDGPQWELPICLKSFPIEADCVHLLEILDISVAQRKFKVWKDILDVLRRSKAIDKIGRSRIFASITEFSFKKVQPFLDILITQLTTVDDVRSFIAGITHSSNQDQDEVRKWCVNQGDRQIMKILGSDEKTLPSFVQYGFVKGLPLLSGIIRSLSEDKTVGFTFWASLVSQLDRQWQSVNSSSFTGAPLRELDSMLDCCIAAMIPLVSEGAIYASVPPDIVDDARHNAEVHVRRAVILVEICLRFSSVRCGGVLSDIIVIPGDIQIKFDLFLRPFARSLRPLLDQYELTIFQPPFFLFYRFLVGIYLGFCFNGQPKRKGQLSLARRLCTKKVICDRCEFMEQFLSSEDESKELIVTSQEWKHLRYVLLKLKDRILSPTVTSRGLETTVLIEKRSQPCVEAAEEFFRMIGNEEEISKLMEPFDQEVWKALRDEEPFDFDLCLQLPHPLQIT